MRSAIVLNCFPVRILLGLCCLFLSLPPAFAQQANAGKQSFMLSFDDGPMPGRTDKVLQTLKQLRTAEGKPVKAAFFMVSDTPSLLACRFYYAPFEIWAKGSMREHPDIVADVSKAGHYIGNHTAHHSWFRWPWLSGKESMDNEIRSWEATAQLPADQPKLFRPPYMADSTALEASAKAQGYQIVLGYTVGDANPRNSVQDIKDRIASYLASQPVEGPPSVLIFHDTIAITADNLGEIVRDVQAKGYRLVDFNPAKLKAAAPLAGVDTPIPAPAP